MNFLDLIFFSFKNADLTSNISPLDFIFLAKKLFDKLRYLLCFTAIIIISALLKFLIDLTRMRLLLMTIFFK